MILSILIASVEERADKLKALLVIFEKEIFHTGLYGGMHRDKIEVLTEVDNKEISIGLKRQKLLERANGDWIVFFDDDDMPNEGYVEMIFYAIHRNPLADCIGIRGHMTTNGGKPETWCHRLGWKIEGDGRNLLPSGYHYNRPIIHFNPVKRELALKAGFKDLRYGEDMDYAKRLNPLLTKEYFIDADLFHYRYSTEVPHAKKYGCK